MRSSISGSVQAGTRFSATQTLSPDACLECRYQALALDYCTAQREYLQTRVDFEVVQRERQRLGTVVAAKQEVIEVLLPYYPYPLSPELEQKIALS